jgi:asparagine synthase (glutamine-hydrolysing)
MCGIAGNVEFQGCSSSAMVSQMVAGVRHRGPDDLGIWSSPNNHCTLGHTRLKIIDLSELGHQPMVDPQTGNCIVFNGEIYNFQSLRKALQSEGEKFVSKTDTEVILALYRREGTQCLNKLQGMFAFAIWDPEKEQLFFARDRLGKKPFVYSETKNGIIFCSEIDPLARCRRDECKVDTAALDLYLQLQYIPAPYTIYSNIRKLPPGHWGVFDKEGVRIEKFWDIDYLEKISISEVDAIDALEEKLLDAVRLRMVADVPIGALLSGGVDSSLVVAMMAKLNGGAVKTFSMGFAEQDFNELSYAQQVSDAYGTEHYPEIVCGDVASQLPGIVRSYGEPFADSSAIPSFAVCTLARQYVSVVMNGDGGDELLGGYHKFSLGKYALTSSRVLGNFLPNRLACQLLSSISSADSIPKKLIHRILTTYIRPDLRSVPGSGPFWYDEIRAQLLSSESHDNVHKWRLKWLDHACQAAKDPIDRMLWYDKSTYLPGDLLTKMDIASMHCGLEARSPLLDSSLFEFCAKLPIEFKVHKGVGKYLLKKVAERYFPKDFVHRKKMGFAIPLARWLSGPLSKLLDDILRDSNAMEPLSMRVVSMELDKFRLRGQNPSRIWTLLMYGLWRINCFQETIQHPS